MIPLAVHQAPASANPARGLLFALMLVVIGGGSGCASPFSGGFDSCVDLLCLSWERSGRTAILYADNRYPVPVTISFDFADLEGGVVKEALPQRRILPAAQRTALTRVYLTDDLVRANPQIDFQLGAFNTVPDPEARYAVPFGGSEARPVTQAAGGRTHTGDLRHAIDFAMPIGTPVLAARDGIVVSVADGEGRGGADPRLRTRGNAVVIAHDDATLATYGHLSRGIPVRVGERVVRGQPIAASGNSGFSTGPHLHFHVGLHGGPGEGTTIPIRFENGLEPAVGIRVAPAVPRGGG